MFTCLFTCDDHHKLGDLALHHPFVQLRHDLLDVTLDLVVRRHKHVQSILLDWSEVFSRVDASLEENGVDGVLKELGHRLRGTCAPISRCAR